MTTISNLKRTLGTDLGTRLNKYLIEIPVDSGDSTSLNILCKSANFPERTMDTVPVFHKGRKYNMRGETNYGGTYEVTIIDDNKMTFRKIFDEWMKKVDNSKPAEANNSFGSFDVGISDALNEINAGVNAAKMVKNVVKDPKLIVDMFFGFIEGGGTAVDYQTDINIWQLNRSGEKVYGYVIQNAFPSSIGSITYQDEALNTLTEYTITFTFSEFQSLENKSYFSQALDVFVGEELQATFNNVESLFD